MARNTRALQYEGTATAEGDKISPGKLMFKIKVRNTEATGGGGNDLGISLDGGRTYYPIAPGEEFSEDVLLHYFYVRGENSTTADYSIVVFYG